MKKWDLAQIASEDSQENYEPETIHEHEEGVTCIAVAKTVSLISFSFFLFLPQHHHSQCDKFATGSADHHVHMFTYPKSKFDGTLTRSQLDIRHLAFSPDASMLAVAGE